MRAVAILATFAALTLPLIPVQELLLRTSLARARRFPNWYHKKLCRLLGVRIHVEGSVASGRPVLLISNHMSWLDIPVLSAVAPVSFVAKKEVGSWPGVATLARLQRTIFIDRARRSELSGAAGEILARLALGDAVVLFAEGTSSDGNRVLPFRSSLFAAVRPTAGSEAAPAGAVAQTVSLAYTRLRGVPLGRAGRPRVGWYGDMEMTSHAWALLKAGPIDVRVRIGAPEPLAAFADRKDLARKSEAEVREQVVRMLRAIPTETPIEIAGPPEAARRAHPLGGATETRGKWR